MRDPYDVLGLQRGASYEEVKAAFKRLSMQRHPVFTSACVPFRV